MTSTEGDILAELLRYCTQDLAIAAISPDLALRSAGVDSMAHLRLYAHVVRVYGNVLGDQLLTDSPTLATLAGEIARGSATSVANPAMNPGSSNDGVVPSLGNRYAYLLRRRRNFDYWSICSAPVRLHERVDPDLIELVTQRLFHRFDALRTSFSIRGEVVDEFISGEAQASAFEHVAAPAQAAQENFSIWLAQEIDRQRRKISIDGRLLRIVLITGAPDGQDRLALLVHHSVADGVAFRLLVNALFQEIAANGRGGDTPSDPSFAQFAHQYMASNLVVAESEAKYWGELPWSQVADCQIPLDVDDARNIEANTRHVTRTLEFDRNALTSSEPGIFERLVVAIGRAYARNFRGSWACIAAVHHGRDPRFAANDAANVVGWINDVAPFLVDGSAGRRQSLGDTAAHLRHVSRASSAYNFLRYLDKDLPSGRAFRAHPHPQLSLNYLTDFGATFNYRGLGLPDLAQSTGISELGDTQRAYLLSSGAWLRDNTLTLRWDYSASLFALEHVEQFAGLCMDEFAQGL